MLPPNSLIGMIHTAALPGSPRAKLPIDKILTQAVAEAQILASAGFDGLIVENMHDAPYVNGPHAPEITACMTRIASAVREAAPKLTLGIQILSMGHHEALAVALASSADFIRCENFVYAHVADEGLLATASAGELLRHRKRIGAEHIKVFADIKKKHASHALTADISLADAAHAAEFFGADGIIITGHFTGDPTNPDDLAAARKAVSKKLPVLVGSGATPDQLPDLFAHADAVIVGSYIKKGGVWSNPVDPARARAIVAARKSRR